MSLSDAYVANQNGTIDGQENPLHSLVANSTFEVCHYIAVTNHVYSPMCIIMSNQAWDSMPPEDQQIFMDCLKAVSYTHLAPPDSGWPGTGGQCSISGAHCTGKPGSASQKQAL